MTELASKDDELAAKSDLRYTDSKKLLVDWVNKEYRDVYI